MNANRKSVVALFFALFVQVSAIGISPAAESSVSGVYNLIEINGHRLPAPSWTNADKEQNCWAEVVSGILLLSSDGEWAGLFEERETCPGSGDSASTSEPTSELFAGSFEISGDQIRIMFFGAASLGNISTSGDELIFHVKGVDQFEGQTLDFAFRRK